VKLSSTLQEAAEKAGFVDYMLEPGGGIRVFDNSDAGIVVSEARVRELADQAVT